MAYPSALSKNNNCPWATTPNNWKFQEVVVMNEDAVSYGNTVKAEHWERDQKFEERIEYYFQGMGRQGITDSSIMGFYSELAAAYRGERSNNMPHLRRVFAKAYDDIYNTTITPTIEQMMKDRALELFLSSEGSLK